MSEITTAKLKNIYRRSYSIVLLVNEEIYGWELLQYILCQADEFRATWLKQVHKSLSSHTILGFVTIGSLFFPGA